MKIKLYHLSIIALAIAGCQEENKMKEAYQWPKEAAPPDADKIEKVLAAHGDSRIDNYYWMNERDSKPVIDYLQAENAYYDTMTSGLNDLKESLFQEMKGRIKEDDESLPVKDNGYWYYTKNEAGKQYEIYCRKKDNLSSPEEVLIDANQMAEGKAYFSLGAYEISDNNEIMAYSIDEVSRRIYTIYFKNLKTGEVYTDKIENAEGGNIVWAADNQHIFYVVKDKVTLLGNKVYRHKLGTPSSQDVLVYEEKDNRYYMGISRTKSKKYITIGVEMNQQNSEYYILDAATPGGKFVSFQPREEGLLYSIYHKDDKFYVLTNLNAPNYKLMETPINNTRKENWKEVIPHRENVSISSVSLFDKYLVLSEVKDAMPKVRVIQLDSGTDYYIDFDESVYSAYVGSNNDFNTDTLRVTYNSMITPRTTYDVNMANKERVMKKRTDVLGGYDPAKYETKMIWATVRDGEKVPMTLLYKKGLKLNGQNPLLLYGYGSYGISMFPGFSSTRFSLVDRGFVYVIAHIRGGEELGRKWYDNGHMMKKMNTFYDFIDCGEFLIKEKYTSKEHLYAHGGSAGGLLMGAVTNLRPDLWNGIVAQVPFVDVITTMSDETIPLTTGEYKEWGNPADSAEYFYIRQYSPVDNVKDAEYPNILVTTGYHDSQVQYFEPAKWVAKLRDHHKGNNVILFKTTMEAGHGGSSGRFNQLKDVAVVYSFLMALEGITK
ncbi:S9 family peptidase [Gynurincola endophyticus]|jgi:oligopeptidase B|uniref:S9 family peptidase n=1 Tax=Gynurincola endophyticus TaxID=2479004 RepID=UPI000F8D11C9|nr:S9 family peptidase [Gynurincola endophyticus]